MRHGGADSREAQNADKTDPNKCTGRWPGKDQPERVWERRNQELIKGIHVSG